MKEVSDSGKAFCGLDEFLRQENERIFEEWEQIARRKLDSAQSLSSEDLRNNLPDVLNAIADESRKAPGRDYKAEPPSKWSKHHAQQRWSLGFSLEEVTREYGLLRNTVLQILVSVKVDYLFDELVFLNAAIDEAIIQAVNTYVASSSQALEDERERLEVTLMGIGDGVVSTDAQGRITDMNPAAERLTGWPRDAAIGRPAPEVLVTLDESTQQPMACLTEAVIQFGKTAKPSSDILLKSREGKLTASEQFAAPLRSSSGHFLGVVLTLRDVSEIRTLTSQLGYLATHDVLTGLPNRALIADRLNQGIAHAYREGSRLAIIFLDLDLFKDINDSLGHAAGDELLKQVADRLSVHTRLTDTVGRMGGDEFVILLPDVQSTDFLDEFCATLIEALCAPYILDAGTVEVSVSTGVSIFPDDGGSPETLLQYADVAMYQAKTLGRNNIQFFKPSMNKRALEHRQMREELRKAITRNQLSLHYQPQISLMSGQLMGAEALLRWHHPRLGGVAPGKFIPVAEGDKDTAIEIGNWVLKQACQQLRSWIDNGNAPLRISINISLVQLRDDRFLRHVDETLRNLQIPPDLIQLELTESILVSDVQGAANRIRALEKRGVRIAVDDFGTGYSSLSYLKDLPVDELKIDQSFTHDIGTDSNKAAIVQAIIRMGESLQLRIIAEGVESLEELNFLRANGCEGAQGHYYSAAIDSQTFESQFLTGFPAQSQY